MVLKDRVQLAWLMKKRGATYRDVAKAAQWRSHGHVGHLISGRKRTVTPAAAIRISELLGVPVEDLFLPRASKNAGRHSEGGKAA